MSLIDAIGAANISSSMPKRGVMFLRRAMTTIMWCAAEPDASALSASFAIFAAILRALTGCTSGAAENYVQQSSLKNPPQWWLTAAGEDGVVTTFLERRNDLRIPNWPALLR
jgi:hypothetical protein